jgi:carbonic anhydrase
MPSKFATVINCMDGRVQDPVNTWMKEKTGAQYIDVVTEAGPDKIMSSTATASRLILKRVLVSRDMHKSRDLALVAHYDCAGNPGTKEAHLRHLKQAGKIISTWELCMNIIMLWVDKNWDVHLVDEFKT